MRRDGRHLDEVSATRHTVIVSTDNLLTQHGIRALARDAVIRWKATDWRKRVPQGASRPALPVHWCARAIPRAAARPAGPSR
jgi:hypothetical protein